MLRVSSQCRLFQFPFSIFGVLFLQWYHPNIVGLKHYIALSFSIFIALSASAQTQDLDSQFKSAVSQYESGKFPEAATQLEPLARQLPNSFEVQELLGLVYAAQSLNAKANDHLEKAVHLKPDDASARTNLANNLLRLGKLDLAEQQFQEAAALAPNDYHANHNLAEFYARSNDLPKALPLFERAQHIDPTSYDNGYDLALAYLLTGRTADARNLIHQIVAHKDTAELHNLLAQVEEKDGNFVAAANEFQTAAHMDPSESNIFDWGCELLLHRTLQPAIEVLRQGATRFPNSPRMSIALGMALYSLGNYDEAVTSLLHAANLAPQDPRSYAFLSRAYDSSPNQVDKVIECFRRFAELQPSNGQATYYYAMSLWKGKRAEDPNFNPAQIESLLKKAIELDPKFAEAHLQLANLYSDQHKYDQSIPAYLAARKLDPDLSDVHYRLAQAYVHTGQKDLAQQEFQVYQQLNAQHLSDLDKQRAEVRQFVYSEKQPSEARP
jgi:tetratricopeptide (TPR) repeat protein